MVNLESVIYSEGRYAAERCIDKLLNIPQILYNSLSTTFEIESQEMVTSCPTGVQKISMVIRAHPKRFSKKLEISSGPVSRVHMRSIIGTSTYDNLAAFTPNGFSIDIGKLSDDGLYLLDYEYQIDIAEFMKSFVDYRCSPEAPSDEDPVYWMEACLKHPDVLRKDFSRFELQDLDFNVELNVSNDINTVIPKTFKKELGAAITMLNETNVHNVLRNGREYISARRNRGQNRDIVLETLSNLQTLFEPRSFSKYVNVYDDFKYTECRRGADYYNNLSIPNWPKSMTVTSRTDLGLNKPAANGKVVYSKYDFLERVREIIEK